MSILKSSYKINKCKMYLEESRRCLARKTLLPDEFAVDCHFSLAIKMLMLCLSALTPAHRPRAHVSPVTDANFARHRLTHVITMSLFFLVEPRKDLAFDLVVVQCSELLLRDAPRVSTERARTQVRHGMMSART